MRHAASCSSIMSAFHSLPDLTAQELRTLYSCSAPGVSTCQTNDFHELPDIAANNKQSLLLTQEISKHIVQGPFIQGFEIENQYFQDPKWTPVVLRSALCLAFDLAENALKQMKADLDKRTIAVDFNYKTDDLVEFAYPNEIKSNDVFHLGWLRMVNPMQVPVNACTPPTITLLCVIRARIRVKSLIEWIDNPARLQARPRRTPVKLLRPHCMQNDLTFAAWYARCKRDAAYADYEQLWETICKHGIEMSEEMEHSGCLTIFHLARRERTDHPFYIDFTTRSDQELQDWTWDPIEATTRAMKDLERIIPKEEWTDEERTKVTQHSWRWSTAVTARNAQVFAVEFSKLHATYLAFWDRVGSAPCGDAVLRSNNAA
jgi:hypothetical protein